MDRVDRSEVAHDQLAGVAERYRHRRRRFAGEERALRQRSRSLSYLRLALFLAMVVCLGVILVRGFGAQRIWLASAALFFVTFALLVRLHRRVEQRRSRFASLETINADALLRLQRGWDDLPLPTAPLQIDGLGGAMVRDLDLFGRGSLFHLLGTAWSPPGRATLAAWLLRPARCAEIERRQSAVAAVAENLDFRQELELRCRPLAEAEPDPEPFLAWAEDEPWLAGHPVLLWWARGSALLTLPLLVAGIFGQVPWILAGFLPLANFTLAYLLFKRLEATFDRVDQGRAGFAAYSAALEILAGENFEDERLRSVAAAVTSGDEPAHLATRRLGRLVVLADTRHGGYVHFIVQALFLWDLHVLSRFEHWQRKYGAQARGWLRALGEIETLAALGGLAADNPDWAFPRLADSPAPNSPAPNSQCLRAERLAHPLLRQETRVGNDVEIGPPGTFLLVTGSNMSGKSTLLRAVGVNVVLAQAGGPVCAARFELPPLTLGTSVLVEDSLTDGYSFFMAELRRLKEIVELAEASHAGGERSLLFLLDEILRGTNAPERRVAVRRVLLHLLKLGAIGAVSTHDLALAEMEGLAAGCRPVHFRETVHTEGEGPRMTFDYRLRPGVATTVNALKLLDLVGLGEETEAST